MRKKPDGPSRDDVERLIVGLEMLDLDGVLDDDEHDLDNEPWWMQHPVVVKTR